MFDPDELAAAFNNRTRAIVINTPNNPTGKVFTREELGVIAGLCRQWDVLAITEEAAWATPVGIALFVAALVWLYAWTRKRAAEPLDA